MGGLFSPPAASAAGLTRSAGRDERLTLSTTSEQPKNVGFARRLVDLVRRPT